MARAALLGRIDWYVATVAERRQETQTAWTLVLTVANWPGHDAGQHVDVRLRAEDGYTAVRSYSIANPPQGERLELTIEQLPDGEVSPYLADTIAIGDSLEVRGPLGEWFVWRPASSDPVQLFAGGSGIVPLMAMVRTRASSKVRPPFRLIYSVRAPESIIYASELRQRATEDEGLTVTYVYTRATPPGWPTLPHRVDAATIAQTAFLTTESPSSFVCGPTPFVEAVANLLTAAKYDSSRIKTERFGPTGGTPMIVQPPMP
jgi:ferredoxin-NADP reductase